MLYIYRTQANSVVVGSHTWSVADLVAGLAAPAVKAFQTEYFTVVCSKDQITDPSVTQVASFNDSAIQLKTLETVIQGVVLALA